MTEKLEITEKRFDEINEKLTDINVINDQEQYKSLMKELKNLTPIIEKYRMYKTARSDFEEAEQMLSDGGLDKDFKEIVQEHNHTKKTHNPPPSLGHAPRFSREKWQVFLASRGLFRYNIMCGGFGSAAKGRIGKNSCSNRRRARPGALM